MALIPLADNDSYPLQMQDGTFVQSRAEHMAYNSTHEGDTGGQSPWGTAGQPVLSNRAAEQSGDEVRTAPGPDGGQWLRVGESGANIPTGDGVYGEGDVVYDPTYGWLISPAAVQRAEAAYGSEDFFDKYGVELAGGLLAGITAPAWMGAGAAGSGGGSIAGAGAADGAASGIANYSTLGLGGGTGTAVAGAGADAALLGGGAVNAAAVSPYSLASGVGGGLGGSATLGGAAALSPYSLGSPSTGGAGTSAGTSAAGTGATTPNLGAAGTAAGAVAPGVLSKIMDGTATADDWAKLLGSVAPGVLGYFGAGSTADAAKEIAAQSRTDRLPALNAFNSTLNDPEGWYKSAPAMGAADAVLRKLSMQGNPAGNPGLMSQAAAYNLGGYQNQLKTLAGPAFGTAGNEMNVNLAGAQAGGGQYDAIGLGLGRLLNTQPDYLNQAYKDAETKYPGLSIGGIPYRP